MRYYQICERLPRICSIYEYVADFNSVFLGKMSLNVEKSKKDYKKTHSTETDE